MGTASVPQPRSEGDDGGRRRILLVLSGVLLLLLCVAGAVAVTAFTGHTDPEEGSDTMEAPPGRTAWARQPPTVDAVGGPHGPVGTERGPGPE